MEEMMTKKLKKAVTGEMEHQGSQILDEIVKILRSRSFRKHNHGQGALMKGAAMLKEQHLHITGDLKKQVRELILNVRDCIAIAIGRTCDSIQYTAQMITQIIKVLEHPCRATVQLLHIAEKFCEELARRLHKQAYRPA